MNAPFTHLYACFVGGSGVGHKKTLRSAKQHLLKQAKLRLESNIRHHQAVADHYRGQLRRLTKLEDEKWVEKS